MSLDLTLASTLSVDMTLTGDNGTITFTDASDSLVLSLAPILRGATGATGAAGANGSDGANGSNGTNGADGDSAYQVAVTNGFVGTELQWLASLVGATGASGADGSNGADGAAGAVWRDGSGAPSSGLGINGDYYLDDANGDVYFKAAGAYSIVGNIKGATGATGSTGSTGATGSAGADGATWRTGSGAPSDALGVNGDLYFRTDTDDVYLKAAGTYSIIANIKGSTGAAGANGTNGTNGTNGSDGAAGSVWRSGSGVPSNALGIDGDYYLDVDTGDVYAKAANAYSLQGNIKGATGATGAAGSNGSNGSNGTNGTDGVNGGVGFTFDTTTTDSDPGAGKFRLDNATIASVTKAYIDNADSGGNTVTGWLDSFDDSTSTVKGTLIIIGAAPGSSTLAIFSVSGSVVDGTGYRKVTLAYVAGSLPSNTQPIRVLFARTGDKGDTGAAGGGGGGTPSVITASPATDQNDYTPTGWDDATYVRLTPSASVVITGFNAATDGEEKNLTNLSADKIIVLAHENAGSTAANRVDLAGVYGRGHRVLLPGEELTLIYDGTSTRWRARPSVGIVEKWVVRSLISNLAGASNNSGVQTMQVGASVRAIPTTPASYIEAVPRVGYQTTTSAGNTALLRAGSLHLIRGNAAGWGGFFGRVAFGVDLNPSTAASRFIGFYGTNAGIGNVDASSLTNIVGIGHDPSQTTYRLLVNDGSGTATGTDLGSNFPVDTTSCFEFCLFTPANGAGWAWAIWRTDDLTITPLVGYETTDIPSNTAPLGFQAMVCNRAANAAYALTFMYAKFFSPN